MRLATVVGELAILQARLGPQTSPPT